MDALIIVASLIATATFITSLILPLGARRSRDSDAPSPKDAYVRDVAARE